MAKAFVSFNDDTITGKAFADLTVSYCKDVDNGAVVTTSCVLTELGLGEYILENPNVTTKRVIMRCYLTSDSTKKFRCAFDPADGNIALDSKQGTPVALDGGEATLAGMLKKMADDNGGATFDATYSSQDKLNSRLPAALTANGNMKSSLTEILTTALTETTGWLAAGFKKFFNVETPTSTMDRITLVDTCTTNSDMRGTDSAALASVCTETRLAELDAANIPANVDTLNTKIGTALTYTDGKPDVNVASQDNIDFGAAQKTSLNAATPASIQSYGSLVSDIVTAVWGAGTRTITNTLLTAQNVWEYAIRKLTSSLTDEGSPKDMSAVNDLTSVSNSLSTIDGIVDDIKTEVLTHPTLTEIEASTVLAKEATLTNSILALAGLIDSIDTSTESAARFTELKGAGWTIENLKAIYDQIGVAIQAISTLEGLVTIGSDAVTITVLDENDDPIPDVVVTIKNSDQSAQITTPVFTDANGKTFDSEGADRVMLDPIDAGYKILCRKVGYTFSVATLTKAEVIAGAKTISGTSWLIGMPSVDPNAVMVYEDLFENDGYTPVTEADVSATATILTLPYDYDDHLHEGTAVDATLHKVDNVFTGRVYWMLVRGAKVQFDIENFNKSGKSFKKTIPTDAGVTQVRLYDLT